VRRTEAPQLPNQGDADGAAEVTHDLDDWLRALFALGWPGKRSGVEWAGPCPKCGGDDRFHLRAGDKAEVVAGCRHGCRFEDLHAALFPHDLLPESPRKRRSPASRAVAPAGPGTRFPAAGDATARKRRSTRGGLLARRLIEGRGLSEPARRWISARGLDADRLHGEGWRTVSRWPDLTDTGFERYPLGIVRSTAVAMPYRTRGGHLRGVRFRTSTPWRRDRERRGLPAPKVLSMPGGRPALYGLHRLPEHVEVLHVAEGELDAESLAEVGVGHVVGLPGASMLRAEAVSLARDLGVRRAVLWLDDDDAGHAGGTRLRDALSAAGVEVLRLTRHAGDVNDLLLAGRLEGLIEAVFER